MSHDPLPGLLRSFNLTTMAGIYAATLKSAEADQRCHQGQEEGQGGWPGSR